MSKLSRSKNLLPCLFMLLLFMGPMLAAHQSEARYDEEEFFCIGGTKLAGFSEDGLPLCAGFKPTSCGNDKYLRKIGSGYECSRSLKGYQRGYSVLTGPTSAAWGGSRDYPCSGRGDIAVRKRSGPVYYTCRPMSEYAACQGTKYLHAINNDGSPDCRKIPKSAYLQPCPMGSLLMKKSSGDWRCAKKSEIVNTLNTGIGSCRKDQVLAATDNGIECVSLLSRISTAEADHCAGEGKILETKIVQTEKNGMTEQTQTWRCVEAPTPLDVNDLDCQVGEHIRKTITGWKCSKGVFVSAESATFEYESAASAPVLQCNKYSYVDNCVVYSTVEPHDSSSTARQIVAEVTSSDSKKPLDYGYTLKISGKKGGKCEIVNARPPGFSDFCNVQDDRSYCTRHVVAECVRQHKYQ